MIAIGFDPGLAHCGFAALALDPEPRLVGLEVFTSDRDRDRNGDTQVRVSELLAWAQARVDSLRGEARLASAAVEWPIATGQMQHRGGFGTVQVFAAAGALLGLLRHQVTELVAPVPASWRAALAEQPKEPTETLHQRLDLTYQVIRHVGKTRAPHALDAVGLALYAAQHRRHA